MATLKEWLTNLDFDFESGIIILQKYKKIDEIYGKFTPPRYRRSDDEIERNIISNDHEVIYHEFDDGYGRNQCPAIIAKDKDAIYFPSQYDGSTELVKIYTDINKYLEKYSETPYPGG